MDQRKSRAKVSDDDNEVINEIQKLAVMKPVADRIEDVSEDTKLANVEVSETETRNSESKKISKADVKMVLPDPEIIEMGYLDHFSNVKYCEEAFGSKENQKRLGIICNLIQDRKFSQLGDAGYNFFEDIMKKCLIITQRKSKSG